ncbi:hypothetical protein D1007_50790 [Hordeum vulgare]|nr:hypothetical protein D1007_50790 [Hordeum vulgare]
MPAYTSDSPNWEVWFALEHEEERTRGMQINPAVPAPPREVKPEEEEEAAYQVLLEAAMQHALKENKRNEDAHSKGLDETLMLSPPPPPPPTLHEPKCFGLFYTVYNFPVPKQETHDSAEK